MKLLLTADFHLGLALDSRIEKSGLPTKLEDTLVQVRTMMAVSKKETAPMIVAGDVFDDRRPGPALLRTLMEMLQDTQRPATILMPGNHDSSDNTQDALAPVRQAGIQYVNVLDNDGVGIFHDTIDGVDFWFVPHISKRSGNTLEKVLEKFPEHEKERPSVLVAHHVIDGAVSGAESLIMKGNGETLPEWFVKSFDIVFSGHVHKHQKFWKGETEVVYIGSPVRCDFGERKEDKGYILFDTASMKWEFVKLPCQEYKQVNVSVDKNAVDFDLLKEAVKGAVVKLVMTGQKVNRNKVDVVKVCRAINEAGFLSKIVWELENEAKKPMEDMSSPAEWLQTFLKERKVPATVMKAVLDIGNEVIQEVME